MKTHRTSRLTLHRETLRHLDPTSLRNAHGALTPDRGTANGCTVTSRVVPCSEAPNKCHFTDPTQDETCSEI